MKWAKRWLIMINNYEGRKQLNELYNLIDELKDIIGIEYLLDTIVQQMSYDELKSCLEFIERKEDLPLFEDDRVEYV